ncbi:MAG: PIG-L family deacetylase [Nanoarchaeota archaeon]|nr:PIG-L family deacetylase [Nanoarchaeota archaeon]MBU1269505.1 PIG-L family deacetylase [Nanoarchaeota archaeon]MBU1603896.1 PIG-L family deacetylase [Nanoarchaeota archaeon]MBU2442902.1 PIG-L family deacetylase [Nanoarchaeota archaeon]
MKKEKHLFLAPHQDDETISMCASIMRQKENAALIFVTNGTPQFEKKYFISQGYKSKAKYKKVRHKEAKNAAKLLGLINSQILFLEINDQEVHKKIKELITLIKKIVKEKNITHIHSSCYEGNHPDHDATRLISGIVAKQTNTKLIEHSTNLVRKEKFELPSFKTFKAIKLTKEEVNIKRIILKDTYKSQRLNVDIYKDKEYLRIAKDNNYSALIKARTLRFESKPEIRLTRKELIGAFAKSRSLLKI